MIKNIIKLSVSEDGVVYAHRNGEVLKSFSSVESAKSWVYNNGYVVEWC